MSLFYLKRVLLASFKFVAGLLPMAIKKDIAKNYIQKRTRESGLQISLYDPKTDLLRFPEATEAMDLLGEGVIADAVPWMHKIKPYLPEGGIIFDIGGFRGITTQWFARVAGHVHTFEPMPESAQSIKQILNVRQISNVSVHQTALSDTAMTSDFYVYSIKGHNSLGKVNTSKYLNTIKVQTLTVDQFSKDNNIDRIDFMKIDVEGFEFEVLKGASEMLASGNIKLILFEANAKVLASIGKSIDMVYELLSSNKYVITDLDGRKVSLADVKQTLFGDFLAFRH